MPLPLALRVYLGSIGVSTDRSQARMASTHQVDVRTIRRWETALLKRRLVTLTRLPNQARRLTLTDKALSMPMWGAPDPSVEALQENCRFSLKRVQAEEDRQAAALTRYLNQKARP